MKNFKKWAPIPPKGWNSWDNYGASVRENEVISNAKFLKNNLSRFGYNYVIVDIQWYEPTANSSQYHDFAPLLMDKYARLIPDPVRFPSAQGSVGFKNLANEIHKMGLKFGIHMMRGIPRQAVYANTFIKDTNKTARDIALNNICPWNSDMFGVNVDLPEGQQYYNSVMNLYASWGVDFIKCDDIAYSKYMEDSYIKEIKALRKAIDQTNRKIVLSLSPGPAPIKHADFFQNNSNMWRITDDFWDDWSLLLEMFDRTAEWSQYSSLGNWPDCDMLPVGKIGTRSNGGARLTKFSHDEQRTMMTLWCIMKSPLIIGSELSKLDDWTLQLLTNKDLLELDNEGITHGRIFRNKELIIWGSSTQNNLYYACFNISDKLITLTNEVMSWSDNAYDVFENKVIDQTDILNIQPHGVKLIKE